MEERSRKPPALYIFAQHEEELLEIVYKTADCHSQYAVIPLSEREVTEDPWQPNAAVLIIESSLASFFVLSTAVKASLKRFVGDGGKLLALGQIAVLVGELFGVPTFPLSEALCFDLKDIRWQTECEETLKERQITVSSLAQRGSTNDTVCWNVAFGSGSIILLPVPFFAERSDLASIEYVAKNEKTVFLRLLQLVNVTTSNPVMPSVTKCYMACDEKVMNYQLMFRTSGLAL